MSVAEVPGQETRPGKETGESPATMGAWLRDLLRRCSATSDHAERAALLTEVALGLDQAAREVAAAGHQYATGEIDADEMVAALHGQAVMARFMAELERGGWARRLGHQADPRA